jgi:hypothetical protein
MPKRKANLHAQSRKITTNQINITRTTMCLVLYLDFLLQSQWSVQGNVRGQRRKLIEEEG